MPTIQETKELLGEDWSTLSDQQIAQIRDSFQALAGMFVDFVLNDREVAISGEVASSR